MAEPFIFIGTHRIREGKLDEFKKQFAELVDVVEANEPRMIAFNGYVNEDETEANVVQVHPDADSMLLHMQVAREHITRGTEELLDTKDIQIYGTPNDAVMGMIEELSRSGVPLIVKPNHLGGFTRSHAG
jgi:quinol monooxygenase YgiN